MKPVESLPLVPYAVELKSILNEDFYNTLLKQVATLKSACSDHFGGADVVHPEQFSIRLGGLDAYKLITKTYDANTCLPLELFIDAPYHLKNDLLKDEQKIRDAATQLEASLEKATIHFKKAVPISNGEFMVDFSTGKVYHPFPDVKANPVTGIKPHHIDSSIFLYQHKITTPDLLQIILKAAETNEDIENNQDLNKLGIVLYSYDVWNHSQKTLSEETRNIIIDYQTSEKFKTLRADMELFRLLKHLKTKPELYASLKAKIKSSETDTDSNAVKSLKEALEHKTTLSENYLKHIQKQMHEMKAMQSELSDAKGNLSKIKEKESFAEKVAPLYADVSTFLSEIQALKEENTQLTLEKTHIASQAKTSHDEMQERIKQLEADLDNEKAARQKEIIKNKNLSFENTRLIEKNKDSNSSHEALLSKKDTEIATLSNKIQPLITGNSTLTKSNKILNEKIIHLEQLLNKKTILKTNQTSVIASDKPNEALKQEETPTQAVTLQTPTPPEIQQPAPTPAKLPDNFAQAIKDRFTWYLLTLFSVEFNGDVPIFDDFIKKCKSNDPERTAFLQKSLSVYMDSITTASDAKINGSNLQYFMSYISKIHPDDDIYKQLEHVLTEVDERFDCEMSSRNISLPTANRIEDMLRIFDLMQTISTLLGNNQNLLKVLNKIMSALNGESDQDKVFIKTITKKFERISKLHHFLLKDRPVIMQARVIYSDFLAHPLDEESEKECLREIDCYAFHEKLTAFNAFPELLLHAQARFCNTVKSSLASHEMLINPVQLQTILALFKNQYSYYTTRKVCFPEIAQHFISIKNINTKDKHQSKQSLADLALKTSQKMLMLLKTAHPNSSAKDLFEEYMYACVSWSDDKKNPQVTRDHDIVRALSPILSNRFHNEILSAKTQDDKIKIIITGIDAARQHIKSSDVFIMDESEHVNFLENMLEFFTMDPVQSDSHNSYNLIQTVISTLQKSTRPINPDAKELYTPDEYPTMLCLYLQGVMYKQKSSAKPLNTVSAFQDVAHTYHSMMNEPEHIPEINKPAFQSLVKQFSSVTTMQAADQQVNLYLHSITLFSYLFHVLPTSDFDLEFTRFIIDLDNKPFSKENATFNLTHDRLKHVLATTKQVCHFLMQWDTYQKKSDLDNASFSVVAKNALDFLENESKIATLSAVHARVNDIILFLISYEDFFADSLSLLKNNNLYKKEVNFPFNKRAQGFFIALATLIHKQAESLPDDLYVSHQYLAEHLRDKHPSTHIKVSPNDIAYVLHLLNEGFKLPPVKKAMITEANKSALTLLSKHLDVNIKRILTDNPNAFSNTTQGSRANNPSPAHIPQLVTLYLVERIQNLSTPNPEMDVLSFLDSYPALEKSYLKHKQAIDKIDNLSALNYPLSTMRNGDVLAYLLTKAAHYVYEWSKLPEDKLPAQVYKDFIIMDNFEDADKALYNDRDEVRLGAIRNRFMILMNLMTAPEMKAFGDCSLLLQTVEKAHAHAIQPHVHKELIRQFGEIGSTQRHLIQYKPIIMNANVLRIEKKPLTQEIILFYHSCPDVIKNQEGLSEAEQYFLDNLKYLKNDNDQLLPPLTEQSWIATKKEMKEAHSLFIKNNPSLQIQVIANPNQTKTVVTHYRDSMSGNRSQNNQGESSKMAMARTKQK